jgi:hypothetical protein
MPINKFLLLSGSGEVEIISGGIVKSLTSQTEQDFLNKGIDSLSTIDPKADIIKKQYFQNNGVVLGSGRTFTRSINLAKYKVNKVTIQ